MLNISDVYINIYIFKKGFPVNFAL